MTGALAKTYETRPLDCWQKCKELRLNHYKEVATARERGKLITSGAVDTGLIPSGIKDCLFMASEPYGASIGFDPSFAQLCGEAVEARGFARDFCAYMRNYLGSMYMDRYLFGGIFPRPDFCLTIHICDAHAKWYQIVSEFYGIPFFGIDLPMGHPEDGREAERIEYVASQVWDAIEWLDEVSGQNYDDERLIEAMHYEYETQALWSEICVLNQAIPAPLDQKSMWSLYVPAAIMKGSREVAEFYRMLRDEVRDRVDRGIAALATERCRLLFDGQPPWFFLQSFRIMEQYGAACVGSHYAFCLVGQFDIDGEGTWHPSRSLKERGIRLKSREEAVRLYAREELTKPMFASVYALPWRRFRDYLGLVKGWHAEGMVVHLNRGCEGLAQYQLETRLALIKAGVPTLTYEGNMADKREFDEAQVIDRLESFMESLGLSKLED
ncbi:MAG: 2-hydroxyacyl-CoA dehydratase subunit D [Dehalococcoidia bacterium]